MSAEHLKITGLRAKPRRVAQLVLVIVALLITAACTGSSPSSPVILGNSNLEPGSRVAYNKPPATNVALAAQVSRVFARYLNRGQNTVQPSLAADDRLDRLAFLTPTDSIAVVDVHSGDVIFHIPSLKSKSHFSYVSLSPDGSLLGALVTNNDQLPPHATSVLIVWRIAGSGAPVRVVPFRNTGLPLEGFEFSGNDNTVVSWLTAYGRLRFWVFNLSTLRLPPSLPYTWGRSDAVAYNPGLSRLILELGTASPCGWLELWLHNWAYQERPVDLSSSRCSGPPNVAVSRDGTLFASSGAGTKVPHVFIWSVASRLPIQSWQQDIEFPGAVEFFDGTRGLAEAQGSHSGSNLASTVDLYRIADHTVVGQYRLRPVPHWSDELTSLICLNGVLVAIEPIGTSNKGFSTRHMYYAFPLPVLK